MNNKLNSLSKLTRNASRNLKKTAISTVAFATLAFGMSAHALAERSLTTVYYVYVDDHYIGMVNDKEEIDKLVEDKVHNTKDSLNNQLDLTVGPEITYIPEQVFSSISKQDNQEVMEKLDELLSIEAVATELTIDEDTSVFVKNREAAEQVLDELKLQYVTKEQLKQIEKRKAEKEALPALKENETRLIDVRLSKNVSISEKKVPPTQVLTVSEAVQYLLKGTLEEKKYKVQEGDVLGQIAADHEMSLDQLLSLNPGLTKESLLKINQELNITVVQPLIEVIVEKETLVKEPVPYQKEVVEDSSMYKGDTKIKQEGKNGSREATYKISERNGVVLNKELSDETVLEQPIPHIVIKGTKVIPSRGEGSFAWPAVGGYISSKQGQRWGKLHKGIDIARPSNRTIKAADNGKIKFAGWSGGYGNKVVIDHQNGYETVYAHLSSITVNVGQSVSKGSQIGVMGSTGNSTGVHLHFEIYKNGNLVNPLDYIR